MSLANGEFVEQAECLIHCKPPLLLDEGNVDEFIHQRLAVLVEGVKGLVESAIALDFIFSGRLVIRELLIGVRDIEFFEVEKSL